MPRLDAAFFEEFMAQSDSLEIPTPEGGWDIPPCVMAEVAAECRVIKGPAIRGKVTWEREHFSWTEEELELPDGPTFEFSYPTRRIPAKALTAAWDGEPVLLALRYGPRHILMQHTAVGRVERGDMLTVDPDNDWEVW